MKLKIITVAGLKGGIGKSSISRLLSEKLNAGILNFDSKRDASFYNAIETLNIKEDEDIKRKEDILIIGGKEISSNQHFLVADFGGKFDYRINDINSDFYILPTSDDFESISETIRTAKMILDFDNKKEIIFVLNKYLIRNKKDEVQAIRDFKDMLIENKLDKYEVFEMPYTKLFKNIVNNCQTEKEIIGENKLLKKNYNSINEFIEKIINKIEKNNKGIR